MDAARDDLEGQLHRLGLTRYQARAYLALWMGGPLLASEVAARADVPRTRIYEICRDLAERGLVAEVAGSGRRFQARPLRNLVEHERARLDQELRSLQERHRQVEAQLERAREGEALPPEEGGLAIIRGPQRVRGHMASLLKRAARNVQLLLGAREAARLRGYLEEVPEGTEVRVVLYPGDDAASLVQAIGRRGWRSRIAGRMRPVTVLVVDGHESLMLIPHEGGGPPAMALWADHPQLVESRVAEFEEAWDAARTPRETEGTSAADQEASEADPQEEGTLEAEGAETTTGHGRGQAPTMAPPADQGSRPPRPDPRAQAGM